MDRDTLQFLDSLPVPMAVRVSQACVVLLRAGLVFGALRWCQVQRIREAMARRDWPYSHHRVEL